MTKEMILEDLEKSAEVVKGDTPMYWEAMGKIKMAYWADVVSFETTARLMDKAVNTYIGNNPA